MQPNSNNSFKPGRLVSLRVLLYVLGIMTVVRLVDLQIVKHNHYETLASSSHQRKYEVPAKRGDIYVRDGEVKVPLALNQTLKLLTADPSIIPDNKRATVARQLSAITGDKEADYLGALSQKSREYVVLRQKVDTAMAGKIAKLKLYGVGLVDHNYRVYPEGQLASQLLGFVNNDGVGQYGVEGYLNSQMSGKPGMLNAKTDTNGVPIATARNIIKAPRDGNSYVLTIDRNIQSQAEKFLKSGVENVRAESGSLVIMDPRTGAIKAMANYPTYDPNDYSRVTDYRLFSNKVIGDQFEPGSGFKVMTMATGLDAGKINPDTTYDDTSGCIKVSNRTICNAAGHKGGPATNMRIVMRDSLNTGMVFILRQLGADSSKITPAGKQLFYDYITKHFGFGARTGVEQAGEAPGKLNPPKTNDVNYANMTFGQGLSVTMLQMTSAVAAIANGGKLYQPYLVSQTVEPNGTTRDTKPRIVNGNVVSRQAASDTTAMMQLVVERGSGYLAKIPGYNIAGKTGTAQIPKANGQGYEENKNIGSFVGFGPVENPRFVMMVRINEPKTNDFAEKTTVPVFANMSKFLLKYYAVPPSG